MASGGPAPVQLPAPLARLLATYAHGAAQVPILTFSEVQQLRRIESTSGHEVRGKVAIDDTGQVLVAVEGRFKEDDPTSGTPLEVRLSDGSIIATKHAYVAGHSGSIVLGNSATFTTEIELMEWRWSTSKSPLAWVATLDGAEIGRSSNLSISGYGKRKLQLATP
jgi:hypothetical protein